MKPLARVSVILSVFMLTGCAQFQVKNTDGLRLAYEDIDRASSKGAELKSLQNVTEQQRQGAADLYREAKATLNSYLQQAITDAASYTVDKNAESYASTKASEKVSSFQSKVNELRASARGETKAFAGEWIAPVAERVITKIKELHDQNQKAAYERFEKIVKEHMMKNFEELTDGKTEK